MAPIIFLENKLISAPDYPAELFSNTVLISRIFWENWRKIRVMNGTMERERDSVALLRRPLNIANFNKLRYINDKIDLEGRLLLLGQLDADRVVGAGVGDLEAAAVGLVLQETHIRDFHIFIKIFVSSVPYPTNEFWSFFQGKQ